jgi:hypothetical protein
MAHILWSDSHGGIVAQVEYANYRIRHSMENRVKVLDALLHEWKSDPLRIWIPLIAGASMLIRLIWSDRVNPAILWGCFCRCLCFSRTERAAAWAGLSDD